MPTPIYRRRNLFTQKIYDILSNEVATLVDEYREAGRYEIEFTIVETGHALSLPGLVHIYKLNAGTLSLSKKMTVINYNL